MKAVIGFFSAAVLGLIIWVWGAQMGHGLTLMWFQAWPVLLGVILVLIFTGIALGGSSRASSGGSALFAVLLGVATIGVWVALPYTAAHKYADSVEEVDKTTPAYEQRAPYDVAVMSARANLQNTTGEAQNTRSLPAEGENGTWNTLVMRKGFLVGYESVQSVQTPLFGTVNAADVTLCEFNENVSLRLGGGLPHDSLDRAIFWATPGNVWFEFPDAYAYCDSEGVPMVVVPLKQLNGFFGSTWTSYGVATLNGADGTVTIITDPAKISEIPGSVYPISLAQDTRNAYQASGDFFDFIFNRSGFDDTSKDMNDPNGSNNAEFSLKQENRDQSDFVTPLTPRGSSSTIVGLGVVDATNMAPGTRNSMVVYKYSNEESRKANSTVANDIKTQYSWMPDWASDLTIFEIVPAGKGTWVASLGQSQSVVYRAEINSDGTIVLYDETGKEVTRSNNGSNQPATGASEVTVTPPADSDLSTLTPGQLRELGDAILDELARRAE